MGRGEIILLKLAHKWEGFVASWSIPQCGQHCSPRNQIESADAIDRQHCCLWIYVGQGLHCVRDASHPLLVNAYKGDVAASMWTLNSCANVLATNRRRMSPTTIPLTPLPSFWRATILPILMASNTSSEMSALTTSEAISYNKSLSLSLRNNTRKCSAVIPDGPPAAPFFAVRKDTKNQSRSNAGSTSGLCSRTSRGIGNLGCCGLRLSSCNARKVMLSRATL